MTAATPLPTNAELCDLADQLEPPLVGEVIAGELFAMGRPRPSHQRIEVEVTSDLLRGSRGGSPPPVGWYIAAEVEVRFSNDEKVVPDISGWRLERVAGQKNDNPLRVSPDWVCEILSDSTRKKDLGVKRDMYARQGVGHLWIIDPDSRQLDAFRLGLDGLWVLRGTFFDKAVVNVAPFEGTPLDMTTWWLEE